MRKLRLGPIQQRVADALAADGFVKIECRTRSSEHRSGDISFSVVERFGLYDAKGKFLRKLTRGQVESCAKKGLLAIGEKEIPHASLLERGVVLRVGPHKDEPLRPDNAETAEEHAKFIEKALKVLACDPAAAPSSVIASGRAINEIRLNEGLGQLPLAADRMYEIRDNAIFPTGAAP